MPPRSATSPLSADARRQGVTLSGERGSFMLRVPAGVRLAEPVAFLQPYASLDVRVGRDASVAVLTVVPPNAGKSALEQRGRVEDGGSVHWQTVLLGGDVEHTLTSVLHGGGARSTADVVFYARGSEKQRTSVRNEFRAPDGGGRITIRGVAEQKASVRCDGMIAIGLEGRGTDTFLTEEVLMLDPTARVDAVPGLEIKTNDVKASHSATVARVGKEDLFYFASRGIPEREARRMFVEGFLSELVERIEHDKLREHIVGLITAKYDRVKVS